MKSITLAMTANATQPSIWSDVGEGEIVLLIAGGAFTILMIVLFFVIMRKAFRESKQ